MGDGKYIILCLRCCGLSKAEEPHTCVPSGPTISLADLTQRRFNLFDDDYVKADPTCPSCQKPLNSFNATTNTWWCGAELKEVTLPPVTYISPFKGMPGYPEVIDLTGSSTPAPE